MIEYYAYLILKFILGFVILILHLNFSGKTQLSQMTPIDFVGNFVLGGVIGGVIYSDDIPMAQYISVLLIGITLITLLNMITKKYDFFRTVALGEPIPIIKDGKFLMDNIREKKNKIDIISVSSRLHAMGIISFQQIAYAQIEPNGEITTVNKGDKIPSVVLMVEGKLRASALKQMDKDEDWLLGKLKTVTLKPEEIFLIEFEDDHLFVTLNDGVTKKIS